MITNTEKERIAAYQRGWNDAQRGRTAQQNQPIMYQIGFIEAMKGAPHRFETHEVEVH